MLQNNLIVGDKLSVQEIMDGFICIFFCRILIDLKNFSKPPGNLLGGVAPHDAFPDKTAGCI
jgi:hypothetical protein